MNYNLSQDKPQSPRPIIKPTTPRPVGTPGRMVITRPPVDKLDSPRVNTPINAKENAKIIPKQNTLNSIVQNTQPLKKPAVIRCYTEDEIREYTSCGYIIVAQGLWDYIPSGAHIRFMKKDNGDGRPRGERFKLGGFVRTHYETESGEKMLMIESKPGGSRKDAGYISYPIAYADIEILWKKYDRGAFIETHLIYNSLAQKKQQIDALNQQVEELKTRVTTLENILRKAIGQ